MNSIFAQKTRTLPSTQHIVVFRTLVVFCFLSFSGCMNMPTNTAQITGTTVSTIPFEGFDCDRLRVELDLFLRRENQLVVAQEQRIKTSQMQAFWWGFGQGDSIEASELASVRGQADAIRRTLAIKRCTGPI